jgi:ubiquinone/menaquinone biosynthesis C-methylase UbiE
MDFSRRAENLTELMDEPGCEPGEVRKALLFLERLNRIGGSHRILAREVRRLNGGPGRVLDIGTGGGDVPAVLLRSGSASLAVGLDTNPAILDQARNLSPRVPLVRADAFQLPFPDQSFDTVVCHLFFHHLDEDQCVALLMEMVRVGKSVVVMDLARSRWLYVLVTVLGWFSGNRLSRHDGPVSVRRAYTTKEIQRICTRAGVNAKIKQHPFWRWTATG